MFYLYATISLVQTISLLKGFVMIFVISFRQQIWWRLSLENLTLYKIGVRQPKRMENSCSYVFRSIFFLYYVLFFSFILYYFFLLLNRYTTWMESIDFSLCNLKTYINHLVRNTLMWDVICFKIFQQKSQSWQYIYVYIYTFIYICPF